MRSVLPLSLILTALAIPGPLAAQDWGLTMMGGTMSPSMGSMGTRASMGTRGSMGTRMGGSMVRADGDPVDAQPSRDRTAVLIARYRGILDRDPRETFAFQRLVDLYRERDGNVQTFVAELSAATDADPSAYVPRMLLGHVYKSQTNVAGARAMYEAAAALRPNDPAPLLAVGRLVQQTDGPAARDFFARALELTRGDQERRELLRELGGLALAASDFDGAAAYYQRYASNASGSIYMMTEFARALVAAGEHARAVAEYQRVLGQLRGDNRVIAPVLKEMASAQLESGDLDGAIATLDRALRVAGQGAGIRREVYDVMVEVYRRSDRLPELVERLDNARDSGAVELRGRIHDELGNEEEALAAYQQVLRIDRRDIDTRVRLIQLLSRSGRIDDVISEYRALVAAAPREPRFVVELAQLLMEVGRRDEALRLAAQAGARAQRDTSVHQALAELYTRWGEDDLAAREIAALVRIDPRDPGNLIALGEQQLDSGDQAAAMATWRRLLGAERDRATGHAAFAGVLADHDLLDQAEEQYREALRLKPDELEYIRGLANVLERPHRGETATQRQTRDTEAVQQWERVLVTATDRALRREARQRVVGVWLRRRELPNRIREWQRAFSAEPPEVDAGRFLAEAHLRRRPRDAAAAERVLERVIELEPGDVESLLALERVKMARGDLEGAMAALEKLVEADPRRATRYLQRMAEHAHAMYRDEDAVRLAAEAVNRSPDDAEGHRRLGDLHRARQDAQSAVTSYRRALELNDRLFPTYFDLAEILIAQGQNEEAAQLYRGVLRLSPDDDLVARAGRAAIQLQLGDNTLVELEQAMLPLALGHPRRPIFRKLVVELYDSLTAPLIQAADGSGSDAELARAELERLGTRAIKPLLEALADSDPAQSSVAIEVLGHLGNENAAGPLLAIAEGDAPSAIRLRALAGAAALALESHVPRLVALSESSERRLQPLATWALARIGGRRALAQLQTLATRGDTSIQTYALLGLGLWRDRSSVPIVERGIATMQHPAVRAAALWTLGQVGDEGHVELLIEHLRRSEPLSSRAASLALGRLASRGIENDHIRAALSEALFSADVPVRTTASRSLWDEWPEEEDVVPKRPSTTVERSVDALLTRDGGRVRPDLATLAPAIEAAGRLALRGPLERALAVLDRIGDDGRLDVGDVGQGALEAVVPSWAGDIASLADHPTPRVRQAVARVLAHVPEAVGRPALIRLLGDSDSTVQKSAIRSARSFGGEEIAAALSNLVRSHPEWPVRLAAAQALARLGAGESALLGALQEDGFAFVREAAAGGLTGYPPAQNALEQAANGDADPRVRAAARAALDGAPQLED